MEYDLYVSEQTDNDAVRSMTEPVCTQAGEETKDEGAAFWEMMANRDQRKRKRRRPSYLDPREHCRVGISKPCLGGLC